MPGEDIFYEGVTASLGFTQIEDCGPEYISICGEDIFPKRSSSRDLETVAFAVVFAGGSRFSLSMGLFA